MSKLWIIAKHEFRLVAANKAFVIITILGPFLILAITVLPGLWASGTINQSKPAPIAIFMNADSQTASSQTVAVDSLIQEFSRRDINIELSDNLENSRAAVINERLSGLLVLSADWLSSGEPRLYSKSGTDVNLFSRVEGALAKVAMDLKILDSGIDAAVIGRILTNPSLAVIKLAADSEEATSDDDFMGILFVSMTFVMLLYMTTLLYGQLIGRAVVVEKTQKTVEIMLSSINARQLMFGKIIGMGLAGLLQYLVWIGMGVISTKLIGPRFGISVPASLSSANFIYLALFFILAFFLYASAYAALGAAAEDEQHLSQLAWPLLIFLILPLMMVTSLIMNPGSLLARIFSLFPMTSPVVMLVRILVSTPPVWEIILCFGLLVLGLAVIALLAARIFRIGILMTGKRGKWGEILGWISKQ